MQTIALIILIITLPIISVLLLLLLNKKTKSNYKEAPRVKIGIGGCAHRSNKDLNVTAMGDNDEYYLCELCNKKVRRSELNG